MSSSGRPSRDFASSLLFPVPPFEKTSDILDCPSLYDAPIYYLTSARCKNLLIPIPIRHLLQQYDK